MLANTLGTAEYEAYFKSRGGQYFICRARNLTALSWERKMNEVSSAKVTISLNSLDPDFCECVSQINPWEHELAIYRNGVEVWVGPVINGIIDLANLTATYDAKDLSAWFDKRWIELRDTDVEFEEADISDVFEWLVRHAYYKQPWNMTWTIPQVQIPIDRVYVSASPDERWSGPFPSVGEEIRNLVRSGVDMTVVRRELITGDLQTESTPLAMLNDQHWATLPAIQIIGSQMATEVGVGGGNGGYYGWYDDQIWIERADADEFGDQFGLLQEFTNEPSMQDEETTKTPNAITQQAYALREVKKQPFVYVKGGELAPDAPVYPEILVPGNVFMVKLTETCRTVEDEYRLYSVSTSFGRDGESMALELVPKGADALGQAV